MVRFKQECERRKKYMDNFLEKLSSYNILNNLFPGAVYCFLMKCICSIDLTSNGIISEILIYYFVGMIISRVGSVIIEPIYKKIRIVSFAEYPKYIEAEKNDAQISILSETNNTYRTMVALCILVLLSVLTISVFNHFGLNKKILAYVAIGLLTVLFSLSYRKQTKYIRNRVEKQIKNKEENS